jgi:hypothetical protein
MVSTERHDIGTGRALQLETAVSHLADLAEQVGAGKARRPKDLPDNMQLCHLASSGR